MKHKKPGVGYDTDNNGTVGGFGFKINDGKIPNRSEYDKACVVRAVAIATGLKYTKVLDILGKSYTKQHGTMTIGAGDCLRRLGWKHTQASSFGPKGITPMTLIEVMKYLKRDETYVFALEERHYVAVVKGVFQDTWDSRFQHASIEGGRRAVVNGWYVKPAPGESTGVEVAGQPKGE